MTSVIVLRIPNTPIGKSLRKYNPCNLFGAPFSSEIGMYSTIIDQLISAHKNHSLKFKKVTDKIQGLTNITFPMTVTSLEGGNVVLNIVPYLLPVIPVADMTLPMSKMDALRPYFKILE